MASSSRIGIAEALGVPREAIEVDLKIRRPEDPQKAQRDHHREMLILRIIWSLSGASRALALTLCWLFLYYGKPEQAEKVVATVIGLIDGIGLGRALPGKD
jgi:hypothetical protein